MAKAYSDDLREKFLKAHQAGEGSLKELAKQFRVSEGWAEKISRTLFHTGSMKRPARGRSGRKSKFTDEVRGYLRAWIAEQPDLTLQELVARLSQELSISSGMTRLWGVLREMGLKHKKDSARQ